MRLYFARGELLLHKNDAGEYSLVHGGVILATFKSEKRAVTEYNRIRQELEQTMPPAEVTPEDRRALLEKYVADTLVKHNSMKDGPAKKPARSRTFG
jgi:hypothetical protein